MKTTQSILQSPKGRLVVVVGAGKSGLAAASLLLKLGARVSLNDASNKEEIRTRCEELRSQGASIVLGGHPPELFASADLIVLSPGVPHLEVFASPSVPCIGDVELVYHLRSMEKPPSTWIGITGTNGKSTVTTLVGNMVERWLRQRGDAGQQAFVGGNLGTPMAEGMASNAHGTLPTHYVLELSSFQLDDTHDFRCKVAALLNITDDHLDRHGTFDQYAKSKSRIFRNQTKTDFSVVDASDSLCMSIAKAGPGSVRSFGFGDADMRIEDGFIVDIHSENRFDLSKLRIHGQHNWLNACAAALIATLAGVDWHSVSAELESFAGLAHRMVHVRDYSPKAAVNIHFYNDSKATNVGATLASLSGFAQGGPKVVLIAGGVDKGGSYEPLVKRMREIGRALVLIGQATPLIADAFASENLPVRHAGDLEEAIKFATDLAENEDSVLLAPACASFDMFQSYAHRGTVYETLVRALV